MSPLASAKVLPCSEESSRARSSYSPWISSRNLNMTRARRCGLVAAQAGNAASALAMACSTSDLLASATLACTSPVLGLNTSPCRPEAPLTSLPPMKWPISRMDGLPGNERRSAGWIWTYCAGFFRDGHGVAAYFTFTRNLSYRRPRSAARDQDTLAAVLLAMTDEGGGIAPLDDAGACRHSRGLEQAAGRLCLSRNRARGNASWRMCHALALLRRRRCRGWI